MIRVVVADDHVIFRHGILRLLESAEDVRVIGEASDGGGTLTAIKEEPDLAVVDLSMPGLDYKDEGDPPDDARRPREGL